MQEPTSIPDILIWHPDTLSESELEELLDVANESDLHIETRRQSISSWASPEWHIPGLISIFVSVVAANVASSLVDGLVKEVAKDFYPSIKNMTIHAARWTHNRLARVITVGTPGKSNPDSPYSLAFSIYYLTRTRHRIKLVYRHDMTAEQWEDLTGQFAEMMNDHFSKAPNDPISRALIGVPVDETLFALMDPVEGWRLGTFRSLGGENNGV